MTRAGRFHAPALDALAAEPRGERAVIELRAPMPGIFVPWIAEGDLVTAGNAIGELAVLGRVTTLHAPRSAGTMAATGLVVQPATTVARAVGYGDVLITLDPSPSLGVDTSGDATLAAPQAVDGLVFRAPTSGRFYGRSAPGKPPFVAPGAQLASGATICLLEVMKTFHRVTYGGPGLPEAARVRQVLVADGDDVNAGDPLLALE
ncbi:MAG TPA: biotin/lipoyl-containing protein [Kofleriaceae bacterium]|jgi:acetyl-CoA carboxylase biotin carboxyl carrier protein|nr:biotin/lipoyl-containing protein [Kofleriaceae bacterium]